jgi:SAM-dependent methyltransferase
MKDKIMADRVAVTFDAYHRRLLELNRATNDLYYRLTARPHHFALYKRLVGAAVARADAIVHLGAGNVWLGDVSDTAVGSKTVYVVEPDAEMLARNPAPNRICAPGESIPLPDESVDAVVCEYVVEHLERPVEVLRELRRILRPGGRFVFVTPNKWSYSGLATWMTPQSFHRHFLAWLFALGASGNEKPFPTTFRMNTRWAIDRYAREAGLVLRELHTGVDHPTYTYPFPVIHQVAVLWHLVLDKLDVLEPLRITLIGVLEKPEV